MLDRVWTVTLPTGMPVTFPPRCVGCGQEFPRGTARLVTRDARHHLAIWAGWLTLEVPACPGCARRLHWRRWGNVGRTLAIAAGAVAFGLFFLSSRVPGFVAGSIVLSLIVAAFVFGFILDRRFPPSFHIDLRGGLTDYEFRDRSYAADFAAMNGAVPKPER